MNLEELETRQEALAELMIGLNDRFNKLCNVLKVINQFHREACRKHEGEIDHLVEWGDSLGNWLEAQLNEVDHKYWTFNQARNEITNHRNRLVDIERLLGMDGSVPRIKPENRVSPAIIAEITAIIKYSKNYSPINLFFIDRFYKISIYFN